MTLQARMGEVPRRVPTLSGCGARSAPLLGLRQVGQVRGGEALERHAERGTFGHPPADPLAQRDS